MLSVALTFQKFLQTEGCIVIWMSSNSVLSQCVKIQDILNAPLVRNVSVHLSRHLSNLPVFCFEVSMCCQCSRSVARGPQAFILERCGQGTSCGFLYSSAFSDESHQNIFAYEYIVFIHIFGNTQGNVYKATRHLSLS